MKKILKSVTLTSTPRLKDRTIKMSFVTDLEQTSEQYMEIDEALNSNGTLYYKPNGTLSQEEIDSIDEVDVEFKGKTKSQRLKAVIWLLSQQEGLDAKDFYSSKMEAIIEHIKSKLD